MEKFRYRILMNKRWNFDDLYVFSRTYDQLLYFFDSFSDDKDGDDQERRAYAFSQFPWQGGYSAVNFFNSLKYSVPAKDRPKISSIQYNSPGWIEIILAMPVATFALAASVKHLCKSIDSANETYRKIYNGMAERELLRIKTEKEKLKLESEHQKFIDASCRSMLKIMGLKNLRDMNRLTEDSYLTLKILMAVYRRLRTLSAMENSEKIDLPVE